MSVQNNTRAAESSTVDAPDPSDTTRPLDTTRPSDTTPLSDTTRPSDVQNPSDTQSLSDAPDRPEDRTAVEAFSPSFRPAWWLPGAHLQTIVPNLLRLRRGPMRRRNTLTLPDGDFVAIDWGPDPGGPLVLILHGLAGCSQSAYARTLMRALHARGFWPGVVHFRGAAGEPNRKLRSYHMAETADPVYVLGEIARKYNRRRLAAIGISLGGSALLHALAEQGPTMNLSCAVAVSVPFDLHASSEHLNRGFSRLYQHYILRHLKRQLRAKCRMLARPDLCESLHRTWTFRDFDSRYTAPTHGFTDVDDYYTRASSRKVLHRITTPTLIIQSRNDPFLPPSSIPDPAELAASIQLEIHDKGGHVGFMEHWGQSYLARRIPAFIDQFTRNT